MTQYPSRFDRDKNYQRVLFTGERFGHSYDFNDAQLITDHRIKSVADIWVKDGGVVDGATIRVDRQTGVVQMAKGRVYANGIVHSVPERTFTVPTDRIVRVGLCVVSVPVDYLTDTDLKGQVPGTRAYGEAGADRLKVTATWTWDGEGACTGTFYGVYTVDNTEVLTPEPPIDPLDDRLARYDREKNGHYIVSGWRVSPLGLTAGKQVFSVSEGVINVWGYKRERQTSYRISILENPDLHHVSTEPHQLPAGQTSGVLFVNHGPVTRYRSVTILRERTVTLTHGAYTGAADILPDTSVAALIEVKQGATTYVQGTDYILTGDSVDWRNIGSPEPSPGSTYTVRYHYYDQIVPAAGTYTPTSVSITNAVAGSTVLFDYDWALPRIDAIAVDRDGKIHYIEGQSSLYSPIPPASPLDMLTIAWVTNKWGQTAEVANIGTRAVHNNTLELHSSLIGDLYDLVAQERLKRDMDAKQPTAKRGVFVDPFLDDDMRDQGLAQTGAIVAGTLRLPIAVKVDLRTIQRRPITMTWTEEVAIRQELFTSSMKVNPYMAFAPLPARVHLDPAVDTWVEFNSSWASPITREVVTVQGAGNNVSRTRTGSSVAVETLRNDTEDAKTIRVIDVLFDIEGFGVGENLSSVTFDSIAVTPRVDPAIGTPLRGDAQGRVRGIFTIPANVPVGAKQVAFTGAAGTQGLGTYVGSGKISTQVMRLVTTDTILEQHWNADPLAQTFTLPSARHISGVDIRFTAIGNRQNKCVVQIRETTVGIPNRNVIAEKILDMTNVQTNVWTHIAFETPAPTVQGAEYAIVVLTDDGEHALAIAALGDIHTAANGTQSYVTQQPYQIGVLLSSSNASTWTPHNNADMAFRVHVAKFNEVEKETPVPQSVTLVNCSDLIVNVGVEEPSVETQVLIKVTRANGDVIYTRPSQPIVFTTPASETISLSIVAKGSQTECPIIYPWVQIIQGTIGAQGTYISRAMPAGNATQQMNVVVTFEVLLPGNATLGVEAGQNGNWTAMVQHSVVPVGDGWQERSFTLSNYALSDARIRLTLNGSSAARPQIRDLRANVTADPINIITGQ